MGTATRGVLFGKKIAIVVTDGFEQIEMTKPREVLEQAGARTFIVSPKNGEVQGWNHTDPAEKFPVDVAIADADTSEYDGLVLPGGVMNPDNLRTDEAVRAFVRGFFDAGKPVAAICHGPWTLIDAGVARGRTMTSWKSIRKDLENAGATVVDREVVVDRGLVTSRTPDDLPAFTKAMVEAIAVGAIPPTLTSPKNGTKKTESPSSS